MSAQLGNLASVIEVFRATYSTTESLAKTINGIKDAPTSLAEIRTRLDTLQSVIIEPLDKELSGFRPSTLSMDQQERLRPVLEHCKNECDRFNQEIMLKEGEDPFDFQVRIRHHIKAAEIRQFKDNLLQYQVTLGVTLGLENLKAGSGNTVELRAFTATCATSFAGISGQIQGLERSMESLSMQTASITKTDVAKVLEALNEQGKMLRACLQVYEPIVKEASVASGTQVEYATAFDRAKVFTGNIDYNGVMGVVKVGKAEARDDARIYTGHFSGASALELLK